ncbi:MAG: Fe-S oxidoreductase, partial [Bowdeniella nasicola]|nr:Fe-S oxidoreductase [Bowdeniella nasicola]
MLHTLAFILAIAATVIGAVVFTRGAVRIAAGIRAGQGSAPGRTEPRGRRTLLVLKEMLGHGRFTHRPVVRVAHWLVMVAFPLLFLSLVTGYGQLLSPDFALPIIGHAYIYEWVIEAIAWLCTAAIIALMVIRYIHRPRGAEAATDRATTDPAVTGSSTTDP